MRYLDFDSAVEPKTLDNRSYLFARTAGSWHGVRPIRFRARRARY